MCLVLGDCNVVFNIIISYSKDNVVSKYHQSESHNQFIANVDNLFHISACESVDSDISCIMTYSSLKFHYLCRFFIKVHDFLGILMSLLVDVQT